MSDFTYERLKENLERLKMKNTLEILDNYLEQALKDKVNVVEILDHIFSEEAKSKNRYKGQYSQLNKDLLSSTLLFSPP